MKLGDKIQGTVGKAKENVGGTVGGQDLRAEGQRDYVKGGVSQIVDNTEERLSDAASGVTGKVEEAKDKLAGR